MIRYFDTSAIVKRYVAERAHDHVVRWYADSDACATASVAYAESLAVLSRRRRNGLFTTAEHDLIEAAFLRDWRRHLVVSLTDDILQSCRKLIRVHPLRGFDAIHLASAVAVKDRANEEVRFVCADQTLAQAAVKVGLPSDNPAD